MPIRRPGSRESEAFRNACRLDDLDEVKALFTLERARMMDSDGRQAMNAAVLFGALEVAKWLHENGIGLDHTIRSGETLMHDACELGGLDTIRWLSSRGVALDKPDNMGRRPKQRACFKGHVHVLEHFRELGVPFSGAELGGSFRDALMQGHIPVVEWLHRHAGISLDAADPRTGAMPIHFACHGGSLELVQWLCARGADVKAQTDDGDTPMHYACFKGFLELAKWLRQSGASLRPMNKSGVTPLDMAGDACQSDVVTWLERELEGADAE